MLSKLHEYHKDELIENISIERIYASTFVNCIFKNCTLNFNAAYVNFLKCQFINCKFGKYTRNKRALAYKCNFDKSKFDIAEGIKFKNCSLNGVIIDTMKFCTLVKCSDKYLKIMEAEDSTKITHSNKTFKVVSMNSTKPKDVRTICSGNIDTNND